VKQPISFRSFPLVASLPIGRKQQGKRKRKGKQQGKASGANHCFFYEISSYISFEKAKSKILSQ